MKRREPRTLIEAWQDLGDGLRELWELAFVPPATRLLDWLDPVLNAALRFVVVPLLRSIARLLRRVLRGG